VLVDSRRHRASIVNPVPRYRALEGRDTQMFSELIAEPIARSSL